MKEIYRRPYLEICDEYSIRHDWYKFCDIT